MGLLNLMGSTDFNPRAELFANGEQGLVADISPQTTLWQDSGKTTRATSPGDPVGYIEDSSGRGNHVTQATSGSRPILSRVPFGGRRNLVNESERFDQTYWTKTRATVSQNSIAAPDGSLTADKIVENSDNNTHFLDSSSFVSTVATWTLSVYAKAGERTVIGIREAAGGTGQMFDLQAGTNHNLTGWGTPASASMEDVGSGWWRIQMQVAFASAINRTFRIHTASDTETISYTGDGSSGIYVWGAQAETGSTATNYQKTAIAGTVVDCTESGVPDCWYLDTSSNKWMQTAAIDFSGTDEMTVIAGVRKLSDAAIAMIAELSVDANSNPNSFYLRGPGLVGANYYFASRGSVLDQLSATTFTAPITNVVTGRSDISGDSNRIRVNGVDVSSSNADQGSGNYGNYALYIGARAGLGLFFNGHLFSFIIRGKTTSGSKLTRAEKYIAKKTGLTI